MCFRPSIVEAAFECPECGKKINPIMGQLPDTCPFCEADISEQAAAAVAGTEAAPPESAFAKPSAPSAPPVGAPQVPGAPLAPGAPQRQ